MQSSIDDYVPPTTKNFKPAISAWGVAWQWDDESAIHQGDITSGTFIHSRTVLYYSALSYRVHCASPTSSQGSPGSSRWHTPALRQPQVYVLSHPALYVLVNLNPVTSRRRPCVLDVRLHWQPKWAVRRKLNVHHEIIRLLNPIIFRQDRPPCHPPISTESVSGYSLCYYRVRTAFLPSTG